MHWYIEVLKKYAVFSGRSRRKEFWLYGLFNGIFAFVLGCIDGLAGLADSGIIGPLGGLYSLAVLIPGTAVGVRRLHDTNRSGWWYLIALVPIIGAIVLLVFWASDSQTGSNQYGPNPKEVAHHRDNPTKTPGVARVLAISAGSAVVVAFTFLFVLLWVTWDTPPNRIIPGAQLPIAYLSELQSLNLVQADERVLFFYSPALHEITEEMYALTESKLVAYGEDWTSPAIISHIDEISEIQFEHNPSWLEDSILIVRMNNGTELFVPLSSEGGGDRRFHSTLEELLGRAADPEDLDVDAIVKRWRSQER